MGKAFPSRRESSQSDYQIGNAREGLLFSSWNICSIGDKKAELGMFLSEEKVAVLALQEVCCSVDDRRLSLHGYQSVIGGADASRKGARGVSLLIRRDLVAAELGEPDGNLAWAKVLIKVLAFCFCVYSAKAAPSGEGTSSRKSTLGPAASHLEICSIPPRA